MSGKKQTALKFVVGFTIALLAIGWKFWPWWFPEFLGENDFEGHVVPPSGVVSTGGTQGTYNGVIAFSNIDRSHVNQLLPTGFELSPRRTTRTPHLHPIVILFGDVTDGSVLISSTATHPTGVHYSEMILAIPFVQKIDGTGGWHTYIVRMYLDDSAAVTGGIPFGYAKVLASVEWTGIHARIWQPYGSEFLESTLRWGARWYDGQEAIDKLGNFEDMVNIMTTEILGENLVCSQFEWNLDRARVARAKTSHTMKQPFKTGMSTWPGLSPYKNVRRGAVVVRGLRWRFQPTPISCRF